jgi:thiosulfate/3-mercaptopyruvate sulfurtransferase
MPFPYLVDVNWLYQHLDDPQLVIVDCRFSLSEPELGRQQYEAGHIPGAYYLDLNQDLSGPVQTHGGRHPLPDWPPFIDRLNCLGIQSIPPSPVVIYDDSRFAFAARLWWMLRYLGHNQVSLLDGGITAWRTAALPLSQDYPQTRTGHFISDPHPEWIVDIDDVRQQQQNPQVALVDARASGRFRGDYEPIDPIAGAIPGALNYFWQDVSDAQGRLKSPEALRQYWQALDDRQEVILYCGSGVTACVQIFSRQVAGKPMGKLYPGGWSDWCSYIVWGFPGVKRGN